MGAHLQSEVWLLKTRLNPYPVKGEMTLAEGKVEVVVTGGADCSGAARDYLEQQTGMAGLAARLEEGEAVKILEFAPGEATVSFPTTSGGYVGVFEVGGKTWNIATAYPAGGAITNLLSMKQGRRLAKEWKEALAFQG